MCGILSAREPGPLVSVASGSMEGSENVSILGKVLHRYF